MKNWYLLYCKRSEQDRAILNLERQGVESFYPQVAVEKIRRGKRGIVQEPLFPSYLFVCFDPEAITFTTVRSTRGIANFICTGNIPRVVPEDLIEFIKSNQDTLEQRDKLRDIYTEGEAVELVKGAFEGADAIFQEPDGEKRSFLLVSIVTSQIKVSVSNSEIRRK